MSLTPTGARSLSGNNRRILLAVGAVVVAVAAAFAIHAAFYKLLRVSLPWGVLPILY